MQHLSLFAVLIAQLLHAMDKPVRRSGNKRTVILARGVDFGILYPHQETISTSEASHLTLSAGFTGNETKNEKKLKIRRNERLLTPRARAEMKRLTSLEEAKVIKEKPTAEDKKPDLAHGNENVFTVSSFKDNYTDSTFEDYPEEVEKIDARDDEENSYGLALRRYREVENIVEREAEQSRAEHLLQDALAAKEHAREADALRQLIENEANDRKYEEIAEKARAECERAMEAETLKANIRKDAEELQTAEEYARKELELELAREGKELQLIYAAEALADKIADQQFLEIEARNAQKEAAILAAFFKKEVKEQAAQEDREKLDLELEKAREIYSLKHIYAEEATAAEIAEQQILEHEAKTAQKEAAMLVAICEKEAKEQAEQKEKAKEEFEAILAEEARAIDEIILNEKAIEEKALRLAIKEAEDEQDKERKALEDIIAKEAEASKTALNKAVEESKLQTIDEAIDFIIEEELEKAKGELDRAMEIQMLHEIIRIEAEEKALDAAIAIDKLAAQSKLEAQDEGEEVFKALALRQRDFEVEVDREMLAKNMVNEREADKAQAKECKELEEIMVKETREERAALKLSSSRSRVANNERADALPNNFELKADKNHAEIGKFNAEERDKPTSEIKSTMEGFDRQIFERECHLRELEDDLRKLAALVRKDSKADISLKFSMKAISSLEAKVMVIILALILGFFLSGPK